MKFAFRAALSLCLLATPIVALPALAQQYSGSGASQQPAAYWLLVNASASGTVVRPQGGNYLFHISGTFSGATITLTENFGANSQTLGTYTSAPATDPCFAIPQGATVQATISGGPPSGMYASIGGVDGGCGVGSSGGGGGNVNLTGINGHTPLEGAQAAGNGSLSVTAAQDPNTVAGASPTATGIYVTGPAAAALATSAKQDTTNTALGAPADSACGTATGTCNWIQLQKYLNSVAGQGVGSTAASVPAQAVYSGCRAATANPTAVTDGQLVGPMCSKGGKVVTDLFAPSDLRVRGHATATDNAAHTIIAAGAGSLKNYITDIQCSRNDAGTSPITLTFSDDVSSTMLLANAGNGGVNNFHTSSPIATAAATAFTFTASTGTTTVACNAQGYQAP